MYQQYLVLRDEYQELGDSTTATGACKMKSQKLTGYFRLVAYSIGHSRLLIRCIDPESEPKNLDLIFSSVKYIETVHRFNNIHLREGSEFEIGLIEAKSKIKIKDSKYSNLYVMESDGRVNFVVASFVDIERNDLPAFDVYFDVYKE